MGLLNGQAVPKNCTLDELKMMLEASDMRTFSLACEALKTMRTTEAYKLLKSRLQEKDKYRYRYIISVIFAFDESAELKDRFLNALQSDDRILMKTALEHLIHKNIWVTDEQILSCFEKHHNCLDGYYYQILLRIAKIERYTSRMIKLLNASTTDSVRIAVAACLTEFATKENFLDIYRLFADSGIAKLRLEACRIACRFDRTDLLQRFAEDADGHVRKYVSQAFSVKEKENVLPGKGEKT